MAAVNKKKKLYYNYYNFMKYDKQATPVVYIDFPSKLTVTIVTKEYF